MQAPISASTGHSPVRLLVPELERRTEARLPTRRSFPGASPMHRHQPRRVEKLQHIEAWRRPSFLCLTTNRAPEASRDQHFPAGADAGRGRAATAPSSSRASCAQGCGSASDRSMPPVALGLAPTPEKKTKNERTWPLSHNRPG